jgi:hypothetical protein
MVPSEEQVSIILNKKIPIKKITGQGLLLTKGVHELVDDVEYSHPQRNPSVKGQSLELLILGIWLRKHLLESFRYHGEKRGNLYKLLFFFKLRLYFEQYKTRFSYSSFFEYFKEYQVQDDKILKNSFPLYLLCCCDRKLTNRALKLYVFPSSRYLEVKKQLEMFSNSKSGNHKSL